MAYGSVMDALGDPTRRAIFDRLRDGPRSVGDIAAALPVSRPAVSQHLRVLKEAGLVADRQLGTRRLYRLRPEGLAELRAYVEGIWDQALAAFAAVAQEGQKGAEDGRRGRNGGGRGRRDRADP